MEQEVINALNVKMSVYKALYSNRTLDIETYLDCVIEACEEAKAHMEKPYLKTEIHIGMQH